ncbi:unnamed protein product, partial [Bubo scandiacus]
LKQLPLVLSLQALLKNLSLWIAYCPSGVSTTPLSLVSSANLLRVSLDPTVYVTDEDIKQYLSQYRPLTDTTCH